MIDGPSLARKIRRNTIGKDNKVQKGHFDNAEDPPCRKRKKSPRTNFQTGDNRNTKDEDWSWRQANNSRPRGEVKGRGMRYMRGRTTLVWGQTRRRIKG